LKVDVRETCELHTLRKGNIAKVFGGFHGRELFGLALILPAHEKKALLNNSDALFSYLSDVRILFWCFLES